MIAIETDGLTKVFNNSGGCRDINLVITGGQIFGLLGPNGAGKSTLVKALLGFQTPTSGRARVLGRPPGDKVALGRIGYLPELFRYHDWLSGADLLQVHGQLYRMSALEIRKRIPEVMELVGLKGKEKQKVKTYSKGMQQRIGLACALLPKPELLFLDEPTSALDPIGRKDVRNILHFLRDQGTTIFLNSHLLSEVEAVCDRFGIINNSRLIVSGSLEELREGRFGVSIRIGSGPRPKCLPEDWRIEPTDEGLQLLTGRVYNRETTANIVAALVREGFKVYEVKEASQSLEDIFVYWVNRQASDGGADDVTHCTAHRTQSTGQASDGGNGNVADS